MTVYIHQKVPGPNPSAGGLILATPVSNSNINNSMSKFLTFDRKVVENSFCNQNVRIQILKSKNIPLSIGSFCFKIYILIVNWPIGDIALGRMSQNFNMLTLIYVIFEGYCNGHLQLIRSPKKVTCSTPDSIQKTLFLLVTLMPKYGQTWLKVNSYQHCQESSKKRN